MIAQLVAAATGLVVMAAPSLFGYGGLAADIDHVVGPLAASVGIMAASHILRAMRWIDVGLGVALLASVPFVTRGATGSVVIGIAAITLVGTAFMRGTVDTDFGGGWAALWRRDERPN